MEEGHRYDILELLIVELVFLLFASGKYCCKTGKNCWIKLSMRACVRLSSGLIREENLMRAPSERFLKMESQMR